MGNEPKNMYTKFNIPYIHESIMFVSFGRSLDAAADVVAAPCLSLAQVVLQNIVN
jgi:hypothetical protein